MGAAGKQSPVFKSRLFRDPGPGAWTFASVPEKYGPHYKMAWGRTPVTATVDGRSWQTSVWTEKTGRVLLPVPKKIRGTKGDGDTVEITLKY